MKSEKKHWHEQLLIQSPLNLIDENSEFWLDNVTQRRKKETWLSIGMGRCRFHTKAQMPRFASQITF
jgi:hypothetical protein